jgi:hypothetical protein
MSAQNQKNSIKTLVNLLGVASASILLSFPTLAQNTTTTGQQNPGTTNQPTSQQNPGIPNQPSVIQNPGTTNQPTGQNGMGGAGTTGTGQTGTGGAGTTGTGQTGTGGAGTTGTGQTGTGGAGTTGTGQTGTGGAGTTGTGQTGTGGAGTTGTGQTGTGGAGTTGTGQTGTGGAGNRQSNGQQDPFIQYMNAGYAATQQRDYQTALTNFQRALQLRPGNPYATRAISNVQSYMQRGTTSTPNSGGATSTGTNRGRR